MKIEKQQSDQVEIHNQQEKKKELRLLGSQRKIAGLTLWQFNIKTEELTKAKFKESRYLVGGGTKLKVVIEKDCIYFQSLNRKNAIKKLTKR